MLCLSFKRNETFIGIYKDKMLLLQRIAFWWLVLFTANWMQKTLLELCIII